MGLKNIFGLLTYTKFELFSVSNFNTIWSLNLKIKKI